MDMDNNKNAISEMTALDGILASIPNPDPNDLIPILQQIQNEYGYLPKEVLTEMSDRTGIAASRVFGVATFYEQFYLEPRGRHTIKCCRGTACHVKGGPNITEELKSQLGVDPGETTDDMRFTFETVACLGTCFLAPVIMIDKDYYGHLEPRDIKDILERYS
jgi:NADH:ubiquinone oxidoreductase subunit E